MNRILLLMLILVGVGIDVRAQKNLAIGTAFDELAVKQNVTEVVMGAGRLKKYHLNFFRSLEIKNPTPNEQQRIETLLQSDVAQAITNEENGGHKFYELPSRKGMHYYIFYRCSGHSLILIYIEGKATLKQIKEQFLKK